jgi:hypothetical protein
MNKTCENKTCENCKYWELETENDNHEFVYGYCHFNPPQIVFDNKQLREFFLFPRVFNDDWCGKFEVKEDK